MAENTTVPALVLPAPATHPTNISDGDPDLAWCDFCIRGPVAWFTETPAGTRYADEECLAALAGEARGAMFRVPARIGTPLALPKNPADPAAAWHAALATAQQQIQRCDCIGDGVIVPAVPYAPIPNEPGAWAWRLYCLHAASPPTYVTILQPRWPETGDHPAP